MDEKSHRKLIPLLLARLERISADSYWAHRASGIRGSLLRILDKIEKEQPISEYRLDELVEEGFSILVIAAPEKRPVSRIRNE